MSAPSHNWPKYMGQRKWCCGQTACFLLMSMSAAAAVAASATMFQSSDSCSFGLPKLKSRDPPRNFSLEHQIRTEASSSIDQIPTGFLASPAYR